MLKTTVQYVRVFEQAPENEKDLKRALMQAIHDAACGGSTGPSVSLAAVTSYLFTH